MKEFLDETALEEYFSILFNTLFEGKRKKIKLTLFLPLLLTEVLRISSILIVYSLKKSFLKKIEVFLDIKYFLVSGYICLCKKQNFWQSGHI